MFDKSYLDSPVKFHELCIEGEKPCLIQNTLNQRLYLKTRQEKER